MDLRLLRTLLLLLLTLCACSHHRDKARRGPADNGGTAELQDPTHGICSTAPERIEDLSTAMARADDANRRGCHREAAAHLKRIGTRSAELAAPDRARLAIVTALVIAATYQQGYDGHGFTSRGVDLAEAPLPFRTGAFDSYDAIVPRLTKLAGASEVPRELLTDGRLLAAMTRLAPFMTCQGTGFEFARGTTHALGIKALVAATIAIYPGILLDAIEDPGTLAAAAHASAAGCSLREAESFARRAAAAYRRRGDTRNAQLIELFGIEVASFPGGRATELAMLTTEGEAHSETADLVAAAAGKGPRYARATRLEQALANWSAAQSAIDPEAQAQATWLRAIGALVLAADPGKAAVQARELRDSAIRLRRADLLDGSRVVEALAAAELGQFERVGSLLRALDSSFTARDAPGPRVLLTRQLVKAASFLANTGSGREAVQLLRAGAVVATRAPPTEALMYRVGLMSMLMLSGRFDESLDELELGLAEIQRHQEQMHPISRTVLGEQLFAMKETLLTGLGRHDESIAWAATLAPTSVFIALKRAIYQGDIPIIEQIMNRTDLDLEARSAVILMMLSAGRCHLFAEDAAMLLERVLGAADVRFDGPDGPPSPEVLREMWSLVFSSYTSIEELALCGGQLGKPALVERARKLLRIPALQALVTDDVLRSLDAAHAESRGEFGEAARIYLRLGQDAWTRPGGVSSGSVGLSQLAGAYYQQASGAALRGPSPYVAFALSTLEESRARSLRALRASKQHVGSGDLGKLEEIEAELSRHQNRLRALTNLAAAAKDPETADAISSKAAELTRRIEALVTDRKQQIRRLADSDPAAYRAAAVAPPLSILEVQRRLGKRESLIYYLIDAERAMAIVLDAGSIRVVDLTTQNDAGLGVLMLQIRRINYLLDLRTGSSSRGLQWTAEDPSAGGEPVKRAEVDAEIEVLRAELYRRMIRPLEPVIPPGHSVMIVPDAITADFPFAVLGASTAPWIARNPIRILPGAYLLEPPTARARLETAMVVGDPDFGPTSRRSLGTRGSPTAAATVFSQLSGTRDEATAVGKLYDTKPLTGAAASEEEVRAQLERAHVLHFATHGIAVRGDPDRSAIVLAAPGRRSRMDGLLHGFEIERLSLSAQLVVLSACETGRGENRGGEGVLALDRAFLIAGAHTVVSSSWLVPDASTAALMTEFHRALVAGEAADVALARAMLAVQKRPGWQHPRYWSGFRVVGAGLR